jgi:hypothetical protein
MINFKKGPALSLHQTNYVATPAETITAGMVVRISSADGKAYKGFSDGSGGTIAGISANASGNIFGFAINSSTSGDVIESGKIGIYALDGATALETDQYVGTPTVGQYVTTNKDGALVAITDASVAVNDSTTTGAAVDTPRIIGQVIEGVHTLENKGTTTSTLPSGKSFQYQTAVNVITIKLAI